MMKDMLVCALGAFGGTLGFALMINAPGRTVLPASVIAVLGYDLFLFLSKYMGTNLIAAYFFATVLIALLCEIEARMMRMPSTVFLLSALVPLVPGYSLYRAMLALVENDGNAAAAAGFSAAQGIMAIAVGAAVTSVCFRALSRRRHTGS